MCLLVATLQQCCKHPSSTSHWAPLKGALLCCWEVTMRVMACFFSMCMINADSCMPLCKLLQGDHLELFASRRLKQGHN